MGVRENINQHPKRAAGAVAVVVLGILGFGALQNRSSAVSLSSQAYFSDDDGRTFFRDDAARVGPFDRGGKEAVAAHVFAGADGKPFVGYLERAISPQARAEIEQARRTLMERASKHAVPMPDSDAMEQIARNLEVKRPGDKEWVAATDPKAGAVYAVTAPGGGTPTRVAP